MNLMDDNMTQNEGMATGLKDVAPLAEPGNRVLGYLLDSLLILPLKMLCLIPVIGWIIAFVILPLVGAYELSRDVLFGNGQSLGKKAMKLRVVTKSGEPLTWRHSALRNLMGVFTLLQIVPIVGYVAFALHAVFLMVELVVLLATKERLGDRLAQTCVIIAH